MGGSPDPAPTREVTQTSTSEPPAFVRPFITGQGLSGALSAGVEPRFIEQRFQTGTRQVPVSGASGGFVNPKIGGAMLGGRQFTTEPVFDTRRVPNPNFDPDAQNQGFLARAFRLSQEGLQPPLTPGAERVAPFTPSQQAALSGLERRGLMGSPETRAASGEIQATLGRDPLNNPLADRLVSTAQGDIVDQFNTDVAPRIASMSRGSGSFGNTGVAATDAQARFSLARALGDVENQIRLPTFEAERGRQMQAAQLAPRIAAQRTGELQSAFGAGQTRQSQEQAIRDIDFQNLVQQRMEPLQMLDVLGSAINTASGGFGTTTTTGEQFVPRSPNPFLTGAGAAGSALGGIGQLASGLKA